MEDLGPTRCRLAFHRLFDCARAPDVVFSHPLREEKHRSRQALTPSPPLRGWRDRFTRTPVSRESATTHRAPPPADAQVAASLNPTLFQRPATLPPNISAGRFMSVLCCMSAAPAPRPRSGAVNALLVAWVHKAAPAGQGARTPFASWLINLPALGLARRAALRASSRTTKLAVSGAGRFQRSVAPDPH